MSCAFRVGVWPGPLPAGRSAGGPVSGVRGGPVPAEHAAGGGLRPEDVLHGGRRRTRSAVTAADVFEFLAHQRGDRTVVRLADRESGLSARTIARRLSSVSGLYAYLVARGDTPVQVNPVPRGLLTRRQGGSRRSRTAPLVRVPRTLPRILSPGEADRLVGALRTHRDRAMVLAMLLAGLRRCEVLGLRFGRCAGRGPAAGRRGGQGRPSPGGPGREPVLRRARRLPA